MGNGLEQKILKKSPQEHEENVIVLAIREMQIKIKMRYHFTTRRMVTFFLKKKISSAQHFEKLEPLCISAGNVKWYSHYKKKRLAVS